MAVEFGPIAEGIVGIGENGCERCSLTIDSLLSDTGVNRVVIEQPRVVVEGRFFFPDIRDGFMRNSVGKITDVNVQLRPFLDELLGGLCHPARVCVWSVEDAGDPQRRFGFSTWWNQTEGVQPTP